MPHLAAKEKTLVPEFASVRTYRPELFAKARELETLGISRVFAEVATRTLDSIAGEEGLQGLVARTSVEGLALTATALESKWFLETGKHPS